MVVRPLSPLHSGRQKAAYIITTSQHRESGTYSAATLHNVVFSFWKIYAYVYLRQDMSVVFFFCVCIQIQNLYVLVVFLRCMRTSAICITIKD